jgi:hypothetical protein
LIGIVPNKALHTTTGTEESEQIFPSFGSSFSFQPKYFKPHTTKTDGMSSHSSSGIKFTHDMSSQRLKDANVRGQCDDKNYASVQITPGYSASSTIIPTSSRNPSILTKDMHQPSSFLSMHLSKDNKQGPKDVGASFSD